MTETNINFGLEAFCDGVFAIALTLMIIAIKRPSNIELNITEDFWLNLKHKIPVISAFILSFTIILITWAKHPNALKQIHKTAILTILSLIF